MPRLFGLTRTGVLAAALACGLVAAPLTHAQIGPKAREAREQQRQRDARAQELLAQAERQFEANDFAGAEVSLREVIELRPTGWVNRYNLAFALGAQGKDDDAAEALVSAIDAGFFDIRRLQREGALERAREIEPVRTLLADWTRVLDGQADAMVRALSEEFAAGSLGEPTLVRDPVHRVAFVSWSDPLVLTRAREELEQVTLWAEETLFPELRDEDETRRDPVIVVALPARPAFQRWVTRRFGHATRGALAGVGGAYEPEFVRLISSDLGPSLRHEFFHALHWRVMTRQGVRHPLWIMEGLASLVEDVDPAPAGGVRPVPSWRTNTAQRMARSGSLRSVRELASLTTEQFNSQRPLANYAHARAIFLYLLEQGLLRDVVEKLSDPDVGVQRDPTGLRALEAATGSTLPDLDRALRVWLETLPTVPEEILPGMASLGVSVESGQGEGVVVVSVPGVVLPGARRENPPERDPDAPVAGRVVLRPADVILSIDRRPTRDMAELIRVLGARQPGEEVTLTIRRRGEERELRVLLVEKK